MPRELKKPRLFVKLGGIAGHILRSDSCRTLNLGNPDKADSSGAPPRKGEPLAVPSQMPDAASSGPVPAVTKPTGDNPEGRVPAPAEDTKAADGLSVAEQSVAVRQPVIETEPPTMDDQTRLGKTESLLEEHHDVIYGYAYRLSGHAAVAEDIVQEVYLRAFRSIHNLRESAAARSWLLTITRNEFSRWCKKRRPTTSIDTTTDDQLQTDTPSVGAELEQQEWVTRALADLAEDYRIVVAMYYFEELSYSAIASQLEIPIGTVMSRLNRAKKHLKEALLAHESD